MATKSYIPYGADPGTVGRRTATRKTTETRDGVGPVDFHRDEIYIATGREVVNEIMVTSFRTLGAAALTQNLFTLENSAGSTLLLAVRRMTVQLDATAVLAAVAPVIKTSRLAALPTGGTTLTKVAFDTAAPTPAATTIARGATASDGGGATAITATAGTPMWSQFTMRMHTLVGQVAMEDQSLVPTVAQEDPLILRAGEAILVQIVAAATTSNPVTNHWVVNCMVEEYVAL